MPGCVGTGNQPLSADQVTTAFLGATPWISSQILDLSVKRPNFGIDLPEMVPLEPGQTAIEQIVFRASLPEIERGMGKWNLQSNVTGCAPCDGPDCSYHFTYFPGHAWERKRTSLAKREFRTPSYCVEDIQSTKDYEEVFAKIVETMFIQTAYFKEQNITFNALTGLAKKFVIDGNGPQANTANPYVYRNMQGVTSGNLNIDLLEFFYEWMCKMPDVVPFDMVDNAPLYALLCSRQLISHMYRNDNSLRWDARFSNEADALLSKYNFQSVIRGMFIPAPIMYPRRFNLDSNGDPVEVLPLVSGIPAESGTFTGPNPAYELAAYEEVILSGMKPFSIGYGTTVSTLGEGTSFGPEPTFMNEWVWINPQTEQDPLRRVGYFMTVAKMALLPQQSEGIFGVLVARPSVRQVVQYNPVPQCPPTIPTCSNAVPAVSCPTPLIKGVSVDPIVAGQYNILLSAPLDVSVDPTEVVQLGITNGGYINATVVAISTDRKAFSATFPSGTAFDCNDQFNWLFSDNTLGCFAQIDSYTPVSGQVQQLNVLLENPIKAVTNGNAVTVYYRDGTSASWTVVSAGVNQSTNTWRLSLGATFDATLHGDPIAVCVPTGTDATCPACGSGLTTITQCS